MGKKSKSRSDAMDDLQVLAGNSKSTTLEMDSLRTDSAKKVGWVGSVAGASPCLSQSLGEEDTDSDVEIEEGEVTGRKEIEFQAPPVPSAHRVVVTMTRKDPAVTLVRQGLLAGKGPLLREILDGDQAEDLRSCLVSSTHQLAAATDVHSNSRDVEVIRREEALMLAGGVDKKIQLIHALSLLESECAGKVDDNLPKQLSGSSSSLQAMAVPAVPLGLAGPSGSCLEVGEGDTNKGEQPVKSGRTGENLNLPKKHSNEEIRPANKVPVKTSERGPGQPSKTPWRNLFSDNRGSSQGIQMRSRGAKAGPIMDMDDINKVFGFPIIGYIAGRSPGKHAIAQCCNSWNVKYQLHFHGSGWLVIKFDKVEDQDAVLAGGPYIIYGRPLILKVMPDCFDFNDNERTMVPIWVQLPNLPLVFWNGNGLSRIATRIGEPVHSDKLTRTKERLTFARILVEIDVASEQIHEVQIQVPGGKCIKQKIVYEYYPKYCPKCKTLGHNQDSCTHFKVPPPSPCAQQTLVPGSSANTVSVQPAVVDIVGAKQKEVVPPLLKVVEKAQPAPCAQQNVIPSSSATVVPIQPADLDRVGAKQKEVGLEQLEVTVQAECENLVVDETAKTLLEAQADDNPFCEVRRKKKKSNRKVTVDHGCNMIGEDLRLGTDGGGLASCSTHKTKNKDHSAAITEMNEQHADTGKRVPKRNEVAIKMGSKKDARSGVAPIVYI